MLDKIKGSRGFTVSWWVWLLYTYERPKICSQLASTFRL